MAVRGVRGATTTETDRPEDICQATLELLRAIQDANPTMRPPDLGSALFTVTADLQSAFPAQVTRQLPGWQDVPVLCAQEIPVPGSLPRCIRVLLHWNTDLPQAAIHHMYLRAATLLRPDWT